MAEVTPKSSLNSELDQIIKGQTKPDSAGATGNFLLQFNIRTMKDDLEKLGQKAPALGKPSAPAARPVLPAAKPAIQKEKPPQVDFAAQQRKQALEEMSRRQKELVQTYRQAKSLFSTQSWDAAQKELQKISGSANASWWLRWKTKRLLKQIANKQRAKKIIPLVSFPIKPSTALTPPPVVTPTPPIVTPAVKAEPPVTLPTARETTPRMYPDIEMVSKKELEGLVQQKTAVVPPPDVVPPTKVIEKPEPEKLEKAVDIDKLLESLGAEAPSLEPLLKKIPLEQKPVRPPVTKPAIAIPAVVPPIVTPALPATKRRLVLIIVSFIILLALSGWWWWQKQAPGPIISETPTPSQASPTPLTLPSPRFGISKQIVVALTLGQPATTNAQLFSDLDIAEPAPNSLSQIVFKNSEADRWADFDEVIETLEIDFFDLATQKCASTESCASVPKLRDYLDTSQLAFLVLNSASDLPAASSSYAWRIGLIIDLKPTTSSVAILAVLKGLEGSLVNNAGYLWLDQEITIPDTPFQDNLYRQVLIRYQNLPEPAFSFDYAVWEDKIIVATSKNAMYAILDQLLGAAESSASPSASSFPSSNQLNVPY